MNSEEYLKKDITITREERLSRDGKSLSLVISFFGHLSFVTRRFSLTIKGKVSFEGSVVIRFVKA